MKKTTLALAAFAVLALFVSPALAGSYGYGYGHSYHGSFNGYCGSYAAPAYISPVPVTATYVPTYVPTYVQQLQLVLPPPAPVVVQPQALEIPLPPAVTSYAPATIQVEALPLATVTYLQTLSAVDCLTYLHAHYGSRAESLYGRHFGALSAANRAAFHARIGRRR